MFPTLIPHRKRLLAGLASLLLAPAAFGTTNNYSIGIKFGANENLVSATLGQQNSIMAPTDLAGVPGVQQQNWNNMYDPNSTGAQGLSADNSGAVVPTSTTVEWTSNGTWASSGRGEENNGFAANTPDRALMTGYLDTGNATTTTITIRDVSPELVNKGYHVYVYSLGGVVSRGGSVRILDLAGTVIKPYLLISASATANPSTYVRDPGVSHTDFGNYLLFTNLASPSIRIEATTAVNPFGGTPRAPVNAVQLVAANLNEPIVNEPAGNAQFFSISLIDLGAGLVDPASLTIKLNGAAITVKATKQGATTSVLYDYYTEQKKFFASGSTNSLDVAFKDLAGKSYSATNKVFIVPAYTSIPADMAFPTADLTKGGFKVRVKQVDNVRGPGDPNLISNAERQLADGYIDPATGKPFPNVADMSLAGADGYFIEPDFINWNQDAPAAIGNFSATTVPPIEDKPIPGIPGIGGTPTDQYAAEIQAYLQMKAGLYRFGVNSDDGFRFSVGRTPREILGQTLGNFNGGRGSADTTFDFVAPVDGFYPMRLVYWEGTGGANIELFSVDINTGVKSLINDLSSPNPIKAYRETTSPTRPVVTRGLPPIAPVATYPFVFADADVEADITDGSIPVDQSSIILRINNNPQTPAIVKNGSVTTITRKGGLSNLLAAGANNIQLIYSFIDRGTNLTVTNAWAFTVAQYAIIPPANKVPPTSVSGQGFHVTGHQMDRSRDANQGNGGRYAGQGGGANNMPRPEIQLSLGYINPTNNLPYPNLLTPGPNADGSYDVLDYLNFSHAQSAGGPANNSGIFQGATDTQIPGMPGSGTSNFGLDNTVHEFTTYLDLKRGAYMFGGNLDDGFTLSSAPNPRDTLGTFLGARNPGGGNSGTLQGNAAVGAVVLEDGIYPFRLLYWEGGGGVNLEFLSVNKLTGRQVLVNDAGNFPESIQAYNTYSGPSRPWVKFSVYPMSSLWQNQHQQSGPGPILVKVPGGAPAGFGVEIANDAPGIRPFGDAIGAVVANLGSGPVGLMLDGTNVSSGVTVTSIPNSTDKLVLYTPNPPLASGSAHTAGLIYADTTNFWPFTVITYASVPAGAGIPASAADTTARGFHVTVVQSITARTGANSGNSVSSAEAQLAGTPANVALPGPNADKSYTFSIINWNSTKNSGGGTVVETGNFQPRLGGPPDDPIPGIPGPGITTPINAAAEIFAYLDLPAGYQKFGVNGDDGWAVTVATPGQTNGTVLFTTDRGAGNRDIPFAFITPQAGLFPIRLVWYQGGGGGNLEFFTYGANNEKILVNADRPDAVKAYYKVTPPPTLSLSRSGGTITLTYANGKLQSAPAVTGPWTDVAGATSPRTVTPSGGAAFYRVTN